MNANLEVVLSLALPATGDAAADLAAFRRCWASVADKNPTLVASAHAVMLLGLESEGTLEAAAAAIRDSIDAGVYRLSGGSWGRVFNDAFLCATACHRAKYWVHVDDAHVCSRPFWNSARAALRGPGSDLWQLQLSDDWDDLPEARLLRRDGFTEVLPHPDAAAKARLDPKNYEDDEPYLSLWPVFSLRPFVNNLEKFRTATARGGLPNLPFDEEAGWATLQWTFGLRLEQLGARKGVLNPPAFAFADDEDEDME